MVSVPSLFEVFTPNLHTAMQSFWPALTHYVWKLPLQDETDFLVKVFFQCFEGWEGFSSHVSLDSCKQKKSEGAKSGEYGGR